MLPVMSQAQGRISGKKLKMFTPEVSRLLSVDVNIISNSDCMSKNDVYSSKVVNTMLCAGVSQGGKVWKF